MLVARLKIRALCLFRPCVLLSCTSGYQALSPRHEGSDCDEHEQSANSAAGVVYEEVPEQDGPKRTGQAK